MCSRRQRQNPCREQATCQVEKNVCAAGRDILGYEPTVSLTLTRGAFVRFRVIGKQQATSKGARSSSFGTRWQRG